jgi:hypothetical protein
MVVWINYIGGLMRLVNHPVDSAAEFFQAASGNTEGNASLELMRAYRAILDKKYALDHEVIRHGVEEFARENK